MHKKIPSLKRLVLGFILIGGLVLAEFSGVKYAAVWLVGGVLLCLTLLGFYAYYRKRTGNPLTGVTFRESAFIGHPGEGLSLNIRRAGSTILVENPFWQSVFFAALAGFFGPGVIVLFLLFPQEFPGRNDIPLPFLIIIPLIILACTALFLNALKTLFVDKPSIEISMEGVVLKQQGKEILRIRKRDISRLSIEVTHFCARPHLKRRSSVVHNYTLCVHHAEESVTKLCIVDNRQQIEALQTEMGNMLQLSA